MNRPAPKIIFDPQARLLEIVAEMREHIQFSKSLATCLARQLADGTLPPDAEEAVIPVLEHRLEQLNLLKHESRRLLETNAGMLLRRH